MRNLTIFRKKSFVGSMIPYHCVFGIDINDFKKHFEVKNNGSVENGVAILNVKNNERVTTQIPNEETTMFVLAITSSGNSYSDVLQIESGNEDISIVLETNYNFAKGSTFKLVRDK